MAMTTALINAGHVITGCCRSREKAASLQQLHGATHSFDAVDVTSDPKVSRWAVQAFDRQGPPDLIINNAAIINPNNKLWNISAADFDQLISINISGTANVLRHFVPQMVSRQDTTPYDGVIVNFSSGWGRSVSAEVAPYCASKWAIEGLTLALARELPDHMCAVSLNPGIINTEMLQSCLGSGAEYYPSPEQWAARAVPFILALNRSHNAQQLSVPD